MIVRITSKYGDIDAVHKTAHKGIDLAMPEGTPLRAVGKGVVDRIYDGSGAIGKGLSIRLEDGTRAIYGHMNDVKVKVGEQISDGEIIGLSGNTGNSTGPHLHFGMKDANGAFVDPAPIADRILANGKIGDGVGDIPQFSVWEWFGGKVSEVTVNNVVDFMPDLIVSLPFLVVASAGVFALINMVSKGGAKLGAIATFLYGIYVIK